MGAARRADLPIKRPAHAAGVNATDAASPAQDGHSGRDEGEAGGRGRCSRGARDCRAWQAPAAARLRALVTIAVGCVLARGHSDTATHDFDSARGTPTAWRSQARFAHQNLQHIGNQSLLESDVSRARVDSSRRLDSTAGTQRMQPGMAELLLLLEGDRAEIERANNDASENQQNSPVLPSAALVGTTNPLLRRAASVNQQAQRKLLDTNGDHDGWPRDATLHPEGHRPFDGDYIGDGETWGDQFTGSLMDMSVGGDVYAWGLNDYGQLGTGNTESVYAPTLVPVLRNKNTTRISAGSEHGLALSKEGFVWSWGHNEGGQLGLSDSTLSYCDGKSLQSNCDGARPGRILFPSSLSDLWGEHVVDISSMFDHNLAVTRSGWTYAWGRNSHGQLGTGDTRDQNVPVKVRDSQANRFVIARTGGSHSIAISAMGKVFVWGSGAYGQLGQDLEGLGERSTNSRSALIPILVQALEDKVVVQIAAGWSHCMALTVDGEAWVWGGNDRGQLGLGDNLHRFAPVKVQESVSGGGRQIGLAISIAGGHGHSLWLNASGLVFSAGRNDGGQLGCGDSIDRNVVSLVDIPDRVWCDTPFGSEVSNSYADLVCVNSKVREDCGQRCVGIPERKDCGPRNSTLGLVASDCEVLMPTSNLGLEVHASEYTSYVLSRDQNLFAWGLNDNGQVGLDPDLWGKFVRKPRLLVSMYGKNTTSIAGGRQHTVARSDREGFAINTFSPESGPVNGGTALFIIGQGFNTFSGGLECRLAYYSNGTHTSRLNDIINGSIHVLTVPAVRYSSVRLKCITPDVRFRDEDGMVDMTKMALFLRTLETPRNITIWWKKKYELPLERTFIWSYIALPGITDIIPKAGPVTGGTFLMITGYGFDPVLSSDVRVRFGLAGNNWMRGCILSDKLIVTVTPPTGPSDSGIMDYDGACNDLCPTGFEVGCECTSINDYSPKCIRGIVRANLDPRNRASRRDRCPDCPYIVGNVMVTVSLNGEDYGDIAFPFLYYENPFLSHLTAPAYTVGHIPGARDLSGLVYGGPEEGGTTVDLHGTGFQAVGLGQGVCSWGCKYTDTSSSIGPKCNTETSRHSLKMQGKFTHPNVFQFDSPYPLVVFDLIHYGTWFRCNGPHDEQGCKAYDRFTGTFHFSPAYSEDFATPTFRGYNATTTVVTSCIEDCESRAEFVSDALIRCIAPPRLTTSGNGRIGADNKTINITVRLKVNGQDIFPDCTGDDCSKYSKDAYNYVYYRQPSIERITPNGGPLADQSFVYVYGNGFTTFNWYPHCQFGRQTTVTNRNSTTFPGWLSHSFRTNSSAWVVNDSLLVCSAPLLPHNAPQLIDEEIDGIKQAEISQQKIVIQEIKDRYLKLPSAALLLQEEQQQAKLDLMIAAWDAERLSIHPSVIGLAFPGKDGFLSTYKDNVIHADVGYNMGTLPVPFTVTFNAQDFLDGGHSHWPFNPPPLTRVAAKNMRFVYYPHPILVSSFPLGGPVVGYTQLIVRGIGFHLYNELSPWVGQYDPSNVSNNGALNENWFNNTEYAPAPPWIEGNATLGWPQNDNNVGFKYAANRTTSIRCRFGNEKRISYTLETTSYFWGYLKREETEWVHSVYADYLAKDELRCQAPAHEAGFADIEISLNSREFTSHQKLSYIYYQAPTVTRIKPSGGPIEGNTMITVTGTNLLKYDGLVRCRFGDESFYDKYYDTNMPTENPWGPPTISPATAIDDSTMICRTPSRVWFGPINVPFALTLNGQDYNMDFGLCYENSNSSHVMWNNPEDPKFLVPGTITYLEMQARQATLINGCPYVYYPHPISQTLVPAGGPIRGGTNIRVFGRGFSIFGEDIRCKFGTESDTWVRNSDSALGVMANDDEILCEAAPHLVVNIGGPEVACTFACAQFPDDIRRCNETKCSFNTAARKMALKQAVAEVVGVRDVYGDIDVLPEDVTIEFYRQPRIPKVARLHASVDVSFCVRCVRGSVSQVNIDDSLKIIKSVRSGYLLSLLKERFGMPGVHWVEINGDPLPFAVTLNGQDYTYQSNEIFSYYMDPTILALNPSGGPLIRYSTADADHRKPTSVDISGTGFINYDEKPQCKFGDEVVTAVAFGDRLMKCDTPWPRRMFADDCTECVFDVWVEISLNGQSFTVNSQVNFRYYKQPEFWSFSPLGGPVEGGTVVTFRGIGYNRFNDGSLRIQWGRLRVFAEESWGGDVLSDDFDPTPQEVEPLTTEWGTQMSDVTSRVIAPSYEEAHDIIQEAYRFDAAEWDYGSAVISNSRCSGMDMPSMQSKIDVGYLPGDTRVTGLPVESRSLYLSGKSKGILSGRYVISKTIDISRGFGLSLWLKHGNASSPLPCEKPDKRDELNFFILSEQGNLVFHSNCTAGCSSPVTVEFQACYGDIEHNLSKSSAYMLNRTRLYEETGKTTHFVEHVVPRCVGAISLKSNNISTVDKASLVLEDRSDISWLQMVIKKAKAIGDPDVLSEARIVMPLIYFTSPKIGLETGDRTRFNFQQCSCLKVYGCALPPCADACSCHNVNQTSCTLKQIDQSRYQPETGGRKGLAEAKIRHLECSFSVAKSNRPVIWDLQIEYLPSNTPPEWNEISQWKRISVFGHQAYPGYTHLSRNLFQNERGRRSPANLNELTKSSAESMIRCPRGKKCYNRRARIMVKQPAHGQGDFDNWALDDLKVKTNGGIVSDTEIFAATPPAHLALPLTESQRWTWKKSGKLTSRYVRGIEIKIAMNNQTYEKSGQKNFCIHAGDSKPDPDDPTNSYKDIICQEPYFNWEEKNWPFQVQEEPQYTNWYEGRKQPNWGKSNVLFRSQVSEQFLYYQHPTIRTVSPSGGPAASHTPVTVFGKGFAAFSDPIRTPKCKFGPLVSAAQVMSDESIVCRTPQTLFSGYVDLTISLNEIDFTSPVMGEGYSVPFLYYEHPIIYSIMPFTGPARGNTELNIVGIGFYQLPTPPACRFIGVNDPSVVADVPGVFLNDTLIRCKSPSIANLCTQSRHCEEGVGSRNPGWRDCPVWQTCPFTNQCKSCGCPDSSLCESYEVPKKNPGDTGTKVTRRQISEDLTFDMEIQVALNGICCVRDWNGLLSDPCEPCTDVNVRCGCVGDFTAVKYDQDTPYPGNTFTFYREVNFEQQGTASQKVYTNSMWSGPASGPAYNPDPIRIYGAYIRNTSLSACALQILCHDDKDCGSTPESTLEEDFGPTNVMRPSYLLCKPPRFAGQRHAMKGTFHASFAANGQDPSKWTTVCDLDVCQQFSFETEPNPEAVQRDRALVGSFAGALALYLYLYRQRMIKKNAKYVADTGGEWEKPALRDAMKVQQEAQFRKYGSQYYPLWTTGAQEMGQLGIGIGLYFQYLRYMVATFCIMSIIAIASIILNHFGKAYANTIPPPGASILGSIGNIGNGFSLSYPTLPSPPVNFLGTGWMWGMPVHVVSIAVALLDIAISLVYVGATWNLRFGQTKIIESLDEDTISAADYTILVENVPGDAIDPDEFRAFFSKYGEVADVAIGLNNGKLIDLFQERGKQELKIEEQIAKLKLYKLQNLQKDLKKMRKKQRKLDEKIIQFRSKSDFKAVCAFVTFNEDKGQSDCVDAYSSSFIQRIRGKSKGTKKFRGKVSLHVTKAPEPSNVLWENLQHRSLETSLRTGVSVLLTITMLIASFSIGLLIQTTQNDLQSSGGSSLCLSAPQAGDPGAKEAIQWTKYTSFDAKLYMGLLTCYCAEDQQNMVKKDPEFCQPYVDNILQVNIMALVAIGAVAGVNSSLEVMLKALSRFQKPHTLSALETTIAQFVFIAQFINTGWLVLIFNMKPDQIESNLFQQLSGFLTKVGIELGQYADTDSAWFAAVGQKMFAQCLTQSVTPNAVAFGKWPQQMIMQALLKNRMMTQKQLDKLFEGPEYELSKRYANFLNIMFVIMMYASGIPMMYFFGVVYFFLAYWADKVAILRGCKRPGQFDEKLAMAATNNMSIAMAVHLLFATWFFGYVDSEIITSSTFGIPPRLGSYFAQGVTLTVGFNEEKMLAARVLKTPSSFVFVFLVVWVAFELIMR